MMANYIKEDRIVKKRMLDFDWVLIMLVFISTLLGIMLLYSVAGGQLEPWAIKQLYTIIIFFPIMIFIGFIPIKILYNHSYSLYFLGLILLTLAELIGHKAMGAQRWIRIGFINFQPSELMKIFVILALARFFHTRYIKDIYSIDKLIIPLVLALLPVLLVLKQPNLGTATIILLISGTIFFVAGVKAWKFIAILAVTLVSTPLIWIFLLHDYQKQRILTFLSPENDPLGAGYNIIQSMIAIGSGGVFGKGFIEGSQTQLSFLPEKQTDFIFTVLAEEFGFTGVAITFIIYLIIIYRCYLISFTLKNHFCRLLIVGICTMFSLHLIINTAMIAGLIPVVGTPFPLFSYGGSNLITMLLGFGLILCACQGKHNTTLK